MLRKPVSILIVEDEALVASYIEEVLGESGFHVAGIAASGPEALSLADEAGPALALVDIRLTGPIDGIELACLLRQKYATAVDLSLRAGRWRDDAARRDGAAARASAQAVPAEPGVQRDRARAGDR